MCDGREGPCVATRIGLVSDGSLAPRAQRRLFACRKIVSLWVWSWVPVESHGFRLGSCCAPGRPFLFMGTTVSPKAFPFCRARRFPRMPDSPARNLRHPRSARPRLDPCRPPSPWRPSRSPKSASFPGSPPRSRCPVPWDLRWEAPRNGQRLQGPPAPPSPCVSVSETDQRLLKSLFSQRFDLGQTTAIFWPGPWPRLWPKTFATLESGR